MCEGVNVNDKLYRSYLDDLHIKAVFPSGECTRNVSKEVQRSVCAQKHPGMVFSESSDREHRC